MRILADECCPRALAMALREAGYDVRHVLEDMRGAPDRAVVEVANRERRLIVSEDYDFAEMAIRHGIPMPGLLLLAFGREPLQLRIERTRWALGEIGEDLLGALTILRAEGMRRRLLRPA